MINFQYFLVDVLGCCCYLFMQLEEPWSEREKYSVAAEAKAQTDSKGEYRFFLCWNDYMCLIICV